MGETDRDGTSDAVPGDAEERESGIEETPADARTDSRADGDRERLDVAGAPADEPTTEVPARVRAGDDGERSLDGEAADEGELRRRLEVRERHLREVYDEVAGLRLAADEARARMEAGEARVEGLEQDRDRLRGRVRELEEEERRRGRRREGQDRHVARLGREIERRDAEIQRLEDLLEARRGEMEARTGEVGEFVARKEAALQEALRRVAGLERDLEERESEAVEERSAADRLRAELDLEYELRRRMAEPANRLRAGIDLFNESEHLRSVQSISKSLGQPEVHVGIGEGDDEPPTVLTFTWRDITWQTYHANPGLAVAEPRVYLAASGEDLSGVDRKPSNARIGPGGKVMLGL